jgi:acyl-CoA thioester hydrolase
MQFSWPIRVYYEDTDAGGVVYHSQYLNYMERARSEWLRHLGFVQSTMREQFGIIFVVRQMQIQFIKPARFDDALQVQTSLIKCSGASLQFQQSIQREGRDLIAAQVEVVCVDIQQFKPCRIPAAMLNIFQAIPLTPVA